jgi:hypothetical protein
VILASCVEVTAWSIIVAYFYNGSGRALPVVILLHATYLAVVSNISAAFPGGRLWVVGFSTAFAAFLGPFWRRE